MGIGMKGFEKKVKPEGEKRKTSALYSAVAAGAKRLEIFREADRSVIIEGEEGELTSGQPMESVSTVNTQAVALYERQMEALIKNQKEENKRTEGEERMMEELKNLD